MTDAFWTALAFVLILEGLMPLLAPSAWRRVFTQMLQLRDGQIRFCGLVSLLVGVLVLAWMA
ncbi:MAG: DUF2065 family protein [Comamonas sp.]|nr:DUF2065 domain-containing protein [Comamonas sp.]